MKSVTLSEYADKTFLAIVRPDYPAKTIGKVKNAISAFSEWYGDDPLMSEITAATIEKFESELPKTPEAYRSYLRLVFRSYAPNKFPKKSKITKPLQDTDGPQILLNAFYAQTYEPNALRSRRPNTKRLYRTTLLKFAEFVGRAATLDDLNDETVNGFAAWRSRDGRLSKHSVNRDLFNLLAIWRWAHRKGYLENWPDVDMEKPPKKTPVAWPKDEFCKIYTTANQLTGKVSGIPAAAWWVALLSVCWDTAERIGAVMALRWSHVDTIERWVKFEAEYRKGARADNLRRIADDTALALASVKRWQETAGTLDPDGLVFVWDRSPTYLWAKYGQILKTAGLPHDAKSKFHRIRKTAASFYEKAGGNATELLGHTKRETTAAYLDPRIVERPEAIDLLFRPMEV
jgi:integrase